MTKEEFIFDKQTFCFDKEETVWTLKLKRSDIATQSIEEVTFLEIEHPLLLRQKSKWDAETVTFAYTVEANGIVYDALKKRRLSEKLRIAQNVTAFEDCLNLPITFFLHPENIFITKNGIAKLAYRALPRIMKPESLSAEDFLRQLKCFILTIFTEDDFNDLYNGALEVTEVPDFLKEIVAAQSVGEVRGHLNESYQDVLKDEEEKLGLLPLRRYKLFKYLTIWFSALSAVLLLPLVYLVFLQLPFQQKMLDADRDFLRVDYSAVVSDLDSVGLDQIPFTQKYELAYSYVQGLDFSNEQRTTILNNISLKSDELILDYWIQIGRADYDEAMDISKRLEDYDLIIYAIAQKIEEVKNDSSLSGSEREEELKSLQSDYETYQEERSSVLNGDESDDSSK